MCLPKLIKEKNLHKMLRRVPSRLLKYSVASRGCHPSECYEYNIHAVLLPGPPKPQSPFVAIKVGQRNISSGQPRRGCSAPVHTTLQTYDSRQKRQFCINGIHNSTQSKVRNEQSVAVILKEKLFCFVRSKFTHSDPSYQECHL